MSNIGFVAVCKSEGKRSECCQLPRLVKKNERSMERLT